VVDVVEPDSPAAVVEVTAPAVVVVVSALGRPVSAGWCDVLHPDRVSTVPTAAQTTSTRAGRFHDMGDFLDEFQLASTITKNRSVSHATSPSTEATPCPLPARADIRPSSTVSASSSPGLT
jgi:hypothetical protein